MRMVHDVIENQRRIIYNDDERRAAVMLQKYLLTTETLTPDQGAIADLNKDGKLNAVDLSLLKRILL